MCVVVKADGYGHGAVPVARAALHAGATWLAVALVEEGAALRREGIGAAVLVLSEPSVEEMDEVVAADLRPTLYTAGGIEAAAKAVASPLPACGDETPADPHPRAWAPVRAGRRLRSPAAG